MPIGHITGWLYRVARNRITDLFRARAPQMLEVEDLLPSADGGPEEEYARSVLFDALEQVITGGIVMLLWNWLLPTLFGFPPITLLQGFGLLALGRILFGGFGGGGGGHSTHRSSKDRERFRQRMNERFCRGDGYEATSPNDASGTP